MKSVLPLALLVVACSQAEPPPDEAPRAEPKPAQVIYFSIGDP